jgi:hypothetical protein
MAQDRDHWMALVKTVMNLRMSSLSMLTLLPAATVSHLTQLLHLFCFQPISVGRISWFGSLPAESFLAPGLVQIYNQEFSSVSDMCMLSKLNLLSDEGKASVFPCRRYISAPHFEYEDLRAVAASRSPWALSILWLYTALSDIYTRYT